MAGPRCGTTCPPPGATDVPARLHPPPHALRPPAAPDRRARHGAGHRGRHPGRAGLDRCPHRRGSGRPGRLGRRRRAHPRGGLRPRQPAPALLRPAGSAVRGRVRGRRVGAVRGRRRVRRGLLRRQRGGHDAGPREAAPRRDRAAVARGRGWQPGHRADRRGRRAAGRLPGLDRARRRRGLPAPAAPARPAPARHGDGRHLGGGRFVLADLVAHEQDTDPDGAGPDSNPGGLVRTGSGCWCPTPAATTCSGPASAG